MSKRCLAARKRSAGGAIDNKKTREKILKRIMKEIPVGKGIRHEKTQPYKEFRSASGNKELDKKDNALIGVH